MKRWLLSGKKGFALIYSGQLISILTTSMAGFALSLWILENSVSVVNYGLARVFHVLPILLLLPLAGLLIDKFNRKWLMILSDKVGFWQH